MTWDSDNPFLRDNYAPVLDELDAGDLPVVAGRIPPELYGAYMRNGPNPAFPPISYTYPFDGDGMVHAVYLENGRARYRNRFVLTRGLVAERRAGRALYGGVLHPVPVDPALVGPDGDPGPIKNGAFIHVIRHAGHVLAMWEGGPAYEMTGDLGTLGEWRPAPGAAAPLPVGPHTRRDPGTGDLYAIAYDQEPPFLVCHVIGRDGVLRGTVPVAIDLPTMMHDFVLTEHHVVLFHCPLVLDLTAAGRGGAPLEWRPERGTRIGLLPRRDLLAGGGEVLWIETEPFWVFHFANGFERNGQVVVDYVRYPRLGIGTVGSEPGRPSQPPALHRITIDPQAGRAEDRRIDDLTVEFPRINDACDSRETRFVYAAARTAPPSGAGRAAGFDTLVKFDLDTGRSVRCGFGGGEIGEAVFAPAPAPAPTGGAEDRGYLMLFVYRPERNGSDFVILDAADPAGEPVAVVQLPRRVPHGLHGSWMPGLDLGGRGAA